MLDNRCRTTHTTEALDAKTTEVQREEKSGRESESECEEENEPEDENYSEAKPVQDLKADGLVKSEPEDESEAKLVQDLKADGLVKNNGNCFTVHTNTFRGKEFVDWIVSHREKGVERGQRLLDKHYIRPVPLSPEVFLDSSSSLYRLLEDFESTALNAGDVGEREDTEEAAKLGEAVRKQMLRLYGTFLSEDGKKVDYQAMKGSAEFEAYAEKTKELQRTHIVDSSREVKLAFFINIYNALVIHGNVIRGSPRNDWQRYKRVMQQLKVAAESFLSGPDGCTVDVDKHTVHLSRILKWYRVDFGKDDQETAQWVYDNMAESETKQQLGDLINSKNFKVAYMKYDWSVNAK